MGVDTIMAGLSGNRSHVRHLGSPVRTGEAMEATREDPVEPLRRFLATSLKRQGVSGQPEGIVEILRPIRRDEERWLRLIADWSEGALQAGDGGSSPLNLSTIDLPYAPPSDEDEARRQRQALEFFLHLRRLLREVARERAEGLQRIGLGDPNHGSTLEELRLAMFLSVAASHGHAQLAFEIPSRISMAADYLILMVWAKHDTSFWRYLEFLGWALSGFMPAAEISYGHRSALAFPIVSERDFEQFCHALCTLVVGYRGVEEASQRDVRMNIFHHTLMLAGMCMEHGFELGHHYYKAKVPPRVALAFLQEHEPEQWARWSGLLETVWGT